MRHCLSALLVGLTVLTSDVYAQVKGNLIEIARKAFDKNPTLLRSGYMIRSAEADLQIQRSVFDLNSFSELSFRNNQYTLPGADPRTAYVENSILRNNVLGLSAGLRKRLRTGQLTEFSLNYGFANNNYPLNSFNQPINLYLGTNTSGFTFSLTQPLLRGRARPIATALERANYLYLLNAKSGNEFTTSYEIWQIGQAYWNYYTAYKNLEIYKQSEDRIRNVLAVTEELVKGDKKPAGDLTQIRSDLANQEKLTIMAGQELYAARIQLGKAIGLSTEESLEIDVPENAFPTIAESAFTSGLDKADFIRMARERRADLMAARHGHEALQQQFLLARNNTKPQLDLTGFVGYGSASTGNRLGDVMASFANNESRSIGTGARLTFTFPVNNNWAKGNLTKSYMALNDQNVVVGNIQRLIELDVSNDLNYLENSVANLQKAGEVLNYNQVVFRDEQVKFQAGLTTLLSLILFQERLMTSQLRYLQAYRQFAQAILNLRHDTGTLIVPDSKGFVIDRNAFYTIPDTSNH
ncbi:TolC family protein [Nibrella viscosa]|uniref:TolC family protein n=1 Tax=Nibrella viscosa TaxID=1084524 RepID=A0ABP8KT29_9BACT